MMKESVRDLLNTQINKELYSAYLYLEFANYFDEQGLAGFQNWYMIQAQEERDHALLMLRYLQMNGEKVTLEAIEKPAGKLESPIGVLQEGLAHEEYVTSLIHTIYGEAYDARDFRTMQFLDWFVKEQAEEEENAGTLIRKMELFGSDPKGLYQLDQELGARVYTAPSLTL